MEAKFTPGKWEAQHIHVSAHCGNLDIDGYHTHCIVDGVDGRTEEEQIANAALIAAAPAMYEAAKEFLSAWESGNADKYGNSIYKLAQAVLSAEGRG